MALNNNPRHLNKVLRSDYYAIELNAAEKARKQAIKIIKEIKENNMKQEVQVILTLEVDADKSKEDIKAFFEDMERTYTRTVTDRNRWEFSKITLIQIKEEAEIYQTEKS